MNIFILSENPLQAAQWQCDKHVVKMVTEGLQCLSCAVIRHNVPTEKLPFTKSGLRVKGGYKHNPCSIWSGDTKGNFQWLVDHSIELAKEYTKRYSKTHFCELGLYQLKELITYIPDGDLQPFYIAINKQTNCRSTIPNFDFLNTVTKYRLFYKMDKPFAKWKQNRPAWMDDSIEKIIKENH